LTLRDRILREGPVRFDVAVEQLLYGDEGFFTRGGGAGRRADFLTSPEVGPLFGAVVARALDAEWARLGRPDPFVVVEAAAGRGALARAVLDATPACRPALRYVCVERSAVLRARLEDRRFRVCDRAVVEASIAVARTRHAQVQTRRSVARVRGGRRQEIRFDLNLDRAGFLVGGHLERAFQLSVT